MKLILIAVLLTVLISQGTSYQCYHCTNNPLLSWMADYDPNCDSPDYSNPDHIQDWPGGYDGCDTDIRSDGYVYRGTAHGHADGECVEEDGGIDCFCIGELCNTNMCEDCPP
ncbi:unnamed protein product [Meganyctiphanes norvegica]|uniref:Uncharacterized protein n=1 Tax=Meganyctiphanes norvegica TaxID=48144 RepID=A0AAV2QBC5_MEGNR